MITKQCRLGKPITAYDLLRAHTKELIGPAHPRSDHNDPTGFSVTYLPNGELMVTLHNNCDLVAVLANARLITQELLEDDTERVSFTRDQTRAATALTNYAESRHDRVADAPLPPASTD